MKSISGLLLILICISCGPCQPYGNKTSPPDNGFEGSFTDFSYKASGSLSDIFGLANPARSKVKLSFDAQGDLKVSCFNSVGGENFRAFKGKQKKRYYEIYFEKKRIPFAPVYGITRIDRVRLRVADDGTLVVDRYRNYSGMIVFFAAGSSSNRQFTFKNK